MNSRNTLNERILRAKTAIFNANSLVIKPYLTAYGYTDEKLNEGQDLLNQTLDLVSTKEQKYGGQFESTESYDIKLAECRKTYARLRKIARVAFRNNNATLRALMISIQVKTTLSGFLHQARTFYSEAVTKPEITAKLAEYSVPIEELQAGLQLLLELESLDRVQTEGTAVAQDSTKERDKAIEALEAWIRDLVDIARVALAEKPQLLEALGRIVKS